MAKIIERQKAQLLRKKGVSINDIADQLMVSKSTVSHWCKDIVLSQRAIQSIINKSKKKCTAGIMKYTEGLRQRRIKQTKVDEETGSNMIKSLSKRERFCVGIGLYWGEGYKRGSQEFGFTNSDPAMIQFYLRWLADNFGVDKSDLILRVSINQFHQKRSEEVTKHWAELIGVPMSQFTKISLIKSASKKLYNNPESHFGTLRIKVRRGTRLRRMVIGAIKSLSELK